MNLSELKTLVIPQGEVYEIFNSMTGTLLWKKNRKFTVVFDPNGGTGTMLSQEFTVGEPQAIQSNTFTKSGNNFYGWSLTPNGSPQYSNGQQVTGIGTCEGTITLYAVWAMSLNTKYTFTSNSTFVVPMTGVYSIEMHGGGGGGGGGVYCRTYMGTGSPTACAYGGNGGGSGVLYEATLIKGTSYAITIGQGGSGGSGAEDEANIAEATADNGQDGGTTKFGSLYSVAGGKGGGGAHVYLYNNKEVDDGANGASVGSLASGSSGGATTGSYGNGGSGGSATYYSGAESGSAGQSGAVFVTLIEYAPYTVNFDANGGSGSMESQTFNVNESQTLTTNAFTYSGYDFIGWSTSPTGNVMYNNGESVINIGNSGETVTLYAIWSIPVGTKYTYTSDTTFVVPATGTYTIELHGGGGGGGGGAKGGYEMNATWYYANGGAGGGSGQTYTTTLTKGTSYALTIGAGGTGGSFKSSGYAATGGTGGTGGTTKFGSLYSVNGGRGGTGGTCYESGGTKSGSAGVHEGTLASGSSGGATVGSYGNGGTGGVGRNSGSGTAGQNGAVIITFVG